ncbi:IS30 family transposase [Aliivibrio logei]|uniref:IS30 family transposase n=1 Tax=Aliivibrio logei TaxID=688 RepID=UPI0035C88CD6
MGHQYKQLTLSERYQIEAWNTHCISAREIGQKLKRSNGSISRELRRCPAGSYSAEQAHRHAFQKRTLSIKHTKCNQKNKKIIQTYLQLGWSPEQISGRMRKEKIENTICCSTIYNVVKREHWQRMLARKGKKYKLRKGVEAGARLIPNRVDISQRPTIVDDKSEVGHWEGDTVYGQDGYLVTMVERVSKLLVTCKVRSKSKKAVTRGINRMMKPFKGLCKTITFDNGGEFAGHAKIAKHLNCDIYFAKPYHSWQRGLNENTNGLLRRFFPKGMAIGELAAKEIKQAEFLINSRPRKALNFLSPSEFLNGKRVSVIVTI